VSALVSIFSTDAVASHYGLGTWDLRGARARMVEQALRLGYRHRYC
jgi:diketogulonate reductase-like aldo/keto reductase